MEAGNRCWRAGFLALTVKKRLAFRFKAVYDIETSLISERVGPGLWRKTRLSLQVYG